MKVVNDKLQEVLVWLFVCVCIAIFLPIIFKNAWLCILGIAFTAVFGIKAYQLYMVKKNKSFFSVKVKCTDKVNHIGSMSSTKSYEFEPLDKDEYTEIINLSIANDEAKTGFLTSKHKIREGCCYNLVFKTDKNGNKVANNSTYIGFERVME